jgi:hypothetical protein
MYDGGYQFRYVTFTTSDIPVGRPTPFYLVINPKTAKPFLYPSRLVFLQMIVRIEQWLYQQVEFYFGHPF